MANFAATAAGFAEAAALCKTRTTAKVWVVAHPAKDINGNVICRFQRFMSPTHPDYGSWVQSRDTAQDA